MISLMSVLEIVQSTSDKVEFKHRQDPYWQMLSPFGHPVQDVIFFLRLKTSFSIFNNWDIIIEVRIVVLLVSEVKLLLETPKKIPNDSLKASCGVFTVIFEKHEVIAP